MRRRDEGGVKVDEKNGQGGKGGEKVNVKLDEKDKAPLVEKAKVKPIEKANAQPIAIEKPKPKPIAIEKPKPKPIEKPKPKPIEKPNVKPVEKPKVIVKPIEKPKEQKAPVHKINQHWRQGDDNLPAPSPKAISDANANANLVPLDDIDDMDDDLMDDDMMDEDITLFNFHGGANTRDTNHKPTLLPLVTYVNRQSTVRRLDNASHDSLVSAMRGLEWSGLIRFKEVKMEQLTIREKIGVVAETAILLGVHGNGLTHQLWMPYTPRSSVIEIFYPGTYLHDHEMVARNMGHTHYAMWNTTSKTYPPEEWFEGFEKGPHMEIHGSKIPVSGPAVAKLVKEILTKPLDRH